MLPLVSCTHIHIPATLSPGKLPFCLYFFSFIFFNSSSPFRFSFPFLSTHTSSFQSLSLTLPPFLSSIPSPFPTFLLNHSSPSLFPLFLPFLLHLPLLPPSTPLSLLLTQNLSYCMIVLILSSLLPIHSSSSFKILSISPFTTYTPTILHLSPPFLILPTINPSIFTSTSIPFSISSFYFHYHPSYCSALFISFLF